MEAESSTSVSTVTFDDLNKRLQASALTTTRKSAVLPGDISFHRSIDQDMAKELNILSSRVLSITNKLLDLVATIDVSKSGKGKEKEKLVNQDDVVDNFHAIVVDSMDQLLENTVSCTLRTCKLWLMSFRIYVWTNILEGIKHPPLQLTRLRPRASPPERLVRQCFACVTIFS